MSTPPRPLALVTGAARRLGRAIALRLAQAGCDVAVHHRNSGADAETTVADLRALGAEAHALAFDLSDPTALDAGFDRIVATFGRAPEVLVNSASMFEWDDIATVTPEALQRHAASNLHAPVLLTRRVFEASTETTRGLILNMLDQKLWNPNADHLSYTLTKYALQGFTAMMARRLAPRFRVCAIAPGYSLPDVGAASSDHFNATHDATPLQRGPTADDIAEAAAYLLRAHAVTGQTLIVDGGAHLVPADRDFSLRS
jgi:NAD(P)-dependent dehydrogenase (short-subunit alcohol dehydrogenase family)